MAKAKEKKAGVQEWMYDIIERPHVTEKATMGSEHGQVTFIVNKSATKPQIKQAVEALFDVKVKGVNTLVMKGKTKRFKGVMGQRSDKKKAIISLEDGQTIDIGSGV
jgi:large subunit ribosomal protein L23